MGSRASDAKTNADDGRPPRAGAGYVAVLGAALLLYLATMAPGVLWQDNGVAQVRVLRRDMVGVHGLALSHPLYYLVAFGFQALPVAESATKTNMVSAVFGAVTVANLYLLLRWMTGARASALAGAVGLAVAHTFWQHCVMAEVYSITTALLTAELLCLHRYSRTGRSGWLVLLVFLNGLGISNHLIAVLGLPAYALLVLWLVWKRRLRSVLLPAMAAAWIGGAGIYLAMIVAKAAGGVPVAAVLREALFGDEYAASVLNVVPGPRLLVRSAAYLLLNFPTPAALLVLPGLLSLRSADDRECRVVICVLLFVHLLWAIRYDVPDQYTFFISSVVLIAVVIGLGAKRFLRGRSRWWAPAVVAAAAVPAAVYVPLPHVARAIRLNIGQSREVPFRDPYNYFLHPWKMGYRGAEEFVDAVRRSLPDGAVLVADSTTAPPLHYARLTGRWDRPIVVYPQLPQADGSVVRLREEGVRSELAAGRLYVVSPQPGYCPRWLLERYTFCKEGLLYRVCGRSATLE